MESQRSKVLSFLIKGAVGCAGWMALAIRCSLIPSENSWLNQKVYGGSHCWFRFAKKKQVLLKPKKWRCWCSIKYVLHSVLNSLLFRVHQTWSESQFSHTVSKLWWYQINAGRYISKFSLFQICKPNHIYIHRIQYLMSMFNEESRFDSPFDKRFSKVTLVLDLRRKCWRLEVCCWTGKRLGDAVYDKRIS